MLTKRDHPRVDQLRCRCRIPLSNASVQMMLVNGLRRKQVSGVDHDMTPTKDTTVSTESAWFLFPCFHRRYQKRSRAAKGGGSAPVFRQEEIVLWIDKENWTNDLQLQ